MGQCLSCAKGDQKNVDDFDSPGSVDTEHLVAGNGDKAASSDAPASIKDNTAVSEGNLVRAVAVHQNTNAASPSANPYGTVCNQFATAGSTATDADSSAQLRAQRPSAALVRADNPFVISYRTNRSILRLPGCATTSAMFSGSLQPR